MNDQPLADMPLTAAIDVMERQRTQLIETMARLIDDVRMGKAVDMGEAASLIAGMGNFCTSEGALQLNKLSLLVRRLPPSQLESLAPYAVGIIFHYDKFPFTIACHLPSPEVITN